MYSAAKRWCVETQTLKNRLSLMGVSTLDQSGNQAEWEKKIVSYTGEEFPDVKSDWTSAGDSKDKKVEAVKKGCKSLVDSESIKSYDSDFEDKYSKVVKWCS
ncbi:hypothetical protein MHF_0474 [Mycoplasma haemofelis Ohio2]|uniref:Uncharacterized protein n=1 Tax=Mycoplasma haemofelis (strain Ohio2) TaxID=859194 RepID=F6FHK7_MYCHI|nr:hypothetical protein MHF_0474 [Mycoplasma haemofelis Ohio2]